MRIERLFSKNGRPMRPSPPVCPVHLVSMICKSTTATIRYYYCNVENCDQSKKVFREDRR